MSVARSLSNPEKIKKKAARDIVLVMRCTEMERKIIVRGCNRSDERSLSDFLRRAALLRAEILLKV